MFEEVGTRKLRGVRAAVASSAFETVVGKLGRK